MTPLELFAILVLAGAVVVLLYFYLQDSRRVSTTTLGTTAAGTGEKTSGMTGTISGVGDTLKGAGAKVTETVTGKTDTSGMSETFSGVGDKLKGASAKVTETVTGKTDTSEKKPDTSEKGEAKSGMSGAMSGVSEKMSGMGEKIKGKVKEVPISTDVLSNRIESFLDERSDQLIKDWELATKSDISGLEKRYDKISRDVGELESRFNEYRGYNNKKIESIEERLSKLENPEE